MISGFSLTSRSLYNSRIRAQRWRRARALAGTRIERQQIFKPSHSAPTPHPALCSRPIRGLPTRSCYLWRTEAALSWFPIAQSLSHTAARDAVAHFTESRNHSHWIPLRDRLIVSDLRSTTVDSLKSIYITDMLGTERLALLFP